MVKIKILYTLRHIFRGGRDILRTSYTCRPIAWSCCFGVLKATPNVYGEKYWYEKVHLNLNLHTTLPRHFKGSIHYENEGYRDQKNVKFLICLFCLFVHPAVSDIFPLT